MVDSSSIRVHQHAANVKNEVRRRARLPRMGITRAVCMERLRGGLATKIRAPVDGNAVVLKRTKGYVFDPAVWWHV